LKRCSQGVTLLWREGISLSGIYTILLQHSVQKDNHEKSDTKNYRHPAQKRSAMETIQQPRKIRSTNGLSARRSRSKKTKVEKPAAGLNTNAFLKQSFGSRTAMSLPSKQQMSRLENNFLWSVNNLGKLYGFLAPEMSLLPYPFSIKEYYQYALQQVAKSQSNVELVIVEDEQMYPVIATVREMDLSLTLYYIPIEPLLLLHRQNNRESCKLLLSIYAYLYQVAGMTLINDGYIGNTYEMMQQNYSDNEHDLEEEEYNEIIRGFKILNKVGPIITAQICNTANLYDFSWRIESCKPVGKFEELLLKVATGFYKLWKEYPDQSFLSLSSGRFMQRNEDDLIFPDQYFSFCWSYNDWMMDQLLEWANCDLQEKSVYDLPLSVQRFDIAHQEVDHDLPLQKQLLGLLDELIDTLSELYE
jgi:hypothetical protein